MYMRCHYCHCHCSAVVTVCLSSVNPLDSLVSRSAKLKRQFESRSNYLIAEFLYKQIIFKPGVVARENVSSDAHSELPSSYQPNVQAAAASTPPVSADLVGTHCPNKEFE